MPMLPWAAEEGKDVKSMLERSGARPVEWLRNPTWDDVKKTTEKKSWDIVHFAGHSHFDASKEVGYLFFADGKRASVVRIDDFYVSLKRPQFVYLSSCNSALDACAFDLIKQSKGSVLSFFYPVQDGKAAKFAQTFYEQFVKKRLSMEYAFKETRFLMKKHDPDDKIWASPILII